MPAASLARLPNDVLLVVADFLTDAGINALTQTNRRFYNALDHSLYLRNAREENSSALQWAAYSGRIGTVKKALVAGADPNSRRRQLRPFRDEIVADVYHSPPLKHIPLTVPLASAAAIGRLDIASALIEAGASVDVGPQKRPERVPLIAAILNDHLDMIKLLIASGKIDIDSCHLLNSDYNLLSFARGSSIEVAQYLLKTMKDPNASFGRCSPPLVVAIREMRFKLVKTLLDCAKIDVNRADGDGLTPLMWAAQCTVIGEELVQLLLQSGKVDVNAVDRTGRTAITRAAQVGSERTVRLLLSAPNIDPNIPDSEGMEPIAHALQLGRMSIVKIFMASDAVTAHTGTLFRLACQLKVSDIIKELLQFDRAEWTATDNKGSTWIHTAATYGCTDVVKTLLNQHHVHINQQRPDGATPLICALQMKRRATTTALLQAGADVNIATIDGCSALFYAAESSSEKFSEELLKRGSNVGAVTNTGVTALHQACKMGMPKVVRVLLDNGADPVRRANNGETPLHVACAARWEQTVRMLLGVIPHSHPILRTGRTPLHDACQAGHTGIAMQLVEHGADPLARLDNGLTPLEYSCHGYPLIAKMLLEKGADPLQTSSLGRSLLYHACSRDTPKVAALLLQYGANPNAFENHGDTAFFNACRSGSPSTIRTLLRYGGDVTLVQQDGTTALHEVCRRINYGVSMCTVVETMVKKGADVNARTQDGLTPLHMACQDGDIDLVTALVAAGADPMAEYVDATTSRCKTPIHIACYCVSNIEIIPALLLKKPRVPVAEFWKSGWTPLHAAAEAANPHAVASLLKHGIDPMVLTDDGRTALHELSKNPVVSDKATKEVVELLMETGKIDINHRDNDGKTALSLADRVPESVRILMVKWGAER